jgi:hypothetical protein
MQPATPKAQGRLSGLEEGTWRKVTTDEVVVPLQELLALRQRLELLEARGAGRPSRRGLTRLGQAKGAEVSAPGDPQARCQALEQLLQPQSDEFDELSVDGFRCDDTGGLLRLAALQGTSTLLELEVPLPGGLPGLVTLALAMLEHTPLARLQLRSDSLGTREAQLLGGALRRNTALLELDLHGNALGDAGAVALSDALGENRTLRVLDLRDTGLGDRGCKKLGHALERHPAVARLRLWQPAGAVSGPWQATMLRLFPGGLVDFDP